MTVVLILSFRQLDGCFDHDANCLKRLGKAGSAAMSTATQYCTPARFSSLEIVEVASDICYSYLSAIVDCRKAPNHCVSAFVVVISRKVRSSDLRPFNNSFF